MKSYKDPVNFKHFEGVKLQSVYNHSPKFQSSKSLRLKNHVLSKIWSKWPPRRWRQTCVRRAKLSITRTQSSWGISLILAVIVAFN